jgi:hypothetical protein
MTKRVFFGFNFSIMTSILFDPAMFAKAPFCLACKRPLASRLLTRSQTQYLHASPALELPRRRDFFSSNAHLAQKQPNNDESTEQLESQKQRKRASRAPAAPTSLRRVAVEAQRSRDGFISKAQLKEQGIDQTKVEWQVFSPIGIYL